MRKVVLTLGLAVVLAAMASLAVAQDYRARVQGTVVDSSKGVAARRHRDAEERRHRRRRPHARPTPLAATSSTSSSRAPTRSSRSWTASRRPRTAPSGSSSAATSPSNFTLEVGGIQETITVVAESTQVQLNSSNAQLTLERQLLDQVPVSGRNPYNLAMLDPTMNPGIGSTANENRPYHHAFANDYDAGGGTRRANDVLLDGVPLGASYKTAYTPAMDAVEEVTVSKTSVDAENGHSLGGIISLNMKSGTNRPARVGLRRSSAIRA